jgi:Fe-S-cluster-containing hydrogenase component 2
VTELCSPLQSLREGRWFKLICGASFQHLPSVRSLTLAYSLAGADCIDVAADPAVITVAREGIEVAKSLSATAKHRGFSGETSPWLMVSLNDGEDPHFRKAQFDPAQCPQDCPRPCERVCPAQAIAFSSNLAHSGVIDSRCYGCGRCVPLCPVQHITTRSYIYTPEAIAPLVLQGVDALEIHTQVGRFSDFKRLWVAVSPFVDRLKLLAISCPDGEDLLEYLRSLYDLIAPLPCPVIWQTDGRPMSGDIGDGATRASVRLGQKVLAADLPGYVQLAGGTNSHTVTKLKALGLLNEAPMSQHQSRGSTIRQHTIAGVAYGSYARSLLLPVLDQLEHNANANATSALALTTAENLALFKMSDLHRASSADLEAHPQFLWQAVGLASSLVTQLKPPMNRSSLV